MSNCLACTPSTTQSYATIEDLQDAGLPPAALEGGPAFTVQRKALVYASRLADTYLRDRYTLPLECPYDPALVDAVVQVACWRLMKRRGFNPSTGIDVAIRQGFEDARDFLQRVANGQAQLCVVQANPESLQPAVYTNVPRGYGGPAGLDLPIVGPNNAGF